MALVCHQLVFEVTELLSEGGKHSVRNTQLLISKKCRDSGTRTRITHWKKTRLQITAITPQRKGDERSAPRTQGKQNGSTIPSPTRAPRRRQPKREHKAAMYARASRRGQTDEKNKEESGSSSPFSSEEPPPFKTPAPARRAVPPTNQRRR